MHYVYNVKIFYSLFNKNITLIIVKFVNIDEVKKKQKKKKNRK